MFLGVNGIFPFSLSLSLSLSLSHTHTNTNTNTHTPTHTTLTHSLAHSRISVLHLAVGLLAKLVWRLLWKEPRRLVECIRERARTARTSFAQRLPTDEPWRRRGWMVMMRARYQDSWTRRPEGWLAMLRRRARRPRKKLVFRSVGPRKAKAAGVRQASNQLELQELGRHPTSFTWAAEWAVKIEEEGIFRHIVMYL